MIKTLLPFQELGAQVLAKNPHYLLADQPGLGKTLQAIRATEIVGARHNLVVCPASVRSNWRQEIEECLGMGAPSYWDIIGYNKAADNTWGPAQTKFWDAIILDEVHFCKTPESKRTQAIFGPDGLARWAQYKWCLTGTPVLNRPRELYPMLKTLCPAFKEMSWSRFTQYFCGAFFDGRGINTRGASHIDELANILQSFMLRRTKREVFPDRVKPLIHKIPVELSAEDMTEVLKAEDEIGGREVRISSRHDDFSQLGDTSRLLRLLGEAMVPHICRFVSDLLETVDKVVVFAHHIPVMMELMDNFSNKLLYPVLYRGGMTDKEKDAARSTFMKDEKCRVFVGQNQAAGLGINGLQTVCSTAVIAEPSWVPGETEQMIDRLDRMGQNDDLVNAYIMYASGTLSAVVVQVHDRKEMIVNRLMRDDMLSEL